MTILHRKRAIKSMRLAQGHKGWGHRYLPRFKTVNGRRFQLHATRGWKCIGKASA